VRCAQIRSSHVLTFYTHAHYRRRFWCPSSGLHPVPYILRVLRTFAGSGLQACASQWSFVTFGLPKVSSLILRRSWPLGSFFRVIHRHLRPPEGELLDSSQVPEGANYPSGVLVTRPSELCRHVRRCFSRPGSTSGSPSEGPIPNNSLLIIINIRRTTRF